MNGRKVYWNKEVADILQVGDSTLRKWCILLEERGYNFLKDEHNRRAFRDEDLIILRRFRDLTRQPGVTLENAANAVIAREEATTGTEVVHAGSQERGSFSGNELREFIQRQEEFNRTLVERLDKQREYYESLLHKQQEYIESAIKARDEQLMNAVSTILEVRKQIAASIEEDRKRKKWWKFW